MSANGDADASKLISTVMPGSSESHAGITFKPVELGTALEEEKVRAFVKKTFPALLTLQPQPIRSVSGGYTTETVQTAFQINKDVYLVKRSLSIGTSQKVQDVSRVIK